MRVVNIAAGIALYLGPVGNCLWDRLQRLYGVIQVREYVAAERTGAPTPQQQRDLPDTSGQWLIHDSYVILNVTT